VMRARSVEYHRPVSRNAFEVVFKLG
jgi:hypothetical protein